MCLRPAVIQPLDWRLCAIAFERNFIMTRSVQAALLAACCATVCSSHHAAAHAVAGVRIFPVTLTIDDPGVADEASIPTFSVQRQGADGGPGPSYQYNFGAEFDKTITKDFGLAINDSYVVNSTENDKTRTGFQDINVTAKYQAWVNPEHEFILSLGVIREFGRTGTAHIGADEYGNTTPTVYFGKGLGDIPVPWLRPFAVTGTFGFSVADKELKATSPGPGGLAASMLGGVTGLTSQTFNNGYSNRWVGGLSLQYSLPYYTSQVKDLGLPDFVNSLVPVVELAWSSPASKPSNLGTQAVFAPGIIYLGQTYQVGVEALIPANRASGSTIGLITQLHLFFDDLFPTTLGKPIFE
jgi:hypothetical protein